MVTGRSPRQLRGSSPAKQADIRSLTIKPFSKGFDRIFISCLLNTGNFDSFGHSEGSRKIKSGRGFCSHPADVLRGSRDISSLQLESAPTVVLNPLSLSGFFNLRKF
jgi:hypothetical protein